jgi:hypothetical protein
MWRTKRYGVAVMARQSGKDVAASMEQCDARLRTPKTTGVYISLNNPTIRDILWDKTYIDPETQTYIRGLHDNVPPEFVDWKDTVMEGRFANKSRLKLQGYFQSGQDKSGVGTSFQDYTITELALFQREDPIPRLMPILENRAEQKRLMVVSTPRGKRRNALWQLMQSLEGNPEYQIITRSIDDLNAIMKKHGQPPILTEAELERIQDAYLKRFGNSRMFDQEYHCSFEEMDAAAVYGEALQTMMNEGRVQDFNLNTGHPLYVMFDIGSSGLHSDATSWIAFQWINNKLFLYDAGEGHGKALPEYVDILREKPWFSRLAKIILPWDAEHHEKAVNTTPADMVRQKFPDVAILAKSSKVWKLPNSRSGDFDLVTDIQQTRMQLYNTIIHATNCEWVLECLEQYKYEYNVKLQEWTQRPLHDRYSHMMDALRYIVQATKEIDFFGGRFHNDSSVQQSSTSYEEDWSGVWRAS